MTIQGRRAPYCHADLVRVLAPRSIAIVGASARAGSFGAVLQDNLKGFAGPVFLVNPRYAELAGQPCYPTVGDLPATPDCAVLAVPREAVEDAVSACAAAGVGGVVIFASGYGETGKAERAAEQARLAQLARTTGIRIIGPNTLGLANFSLAAVLSFGHPPSRMEVLPHAVGLVSQSGALGFALAQAMERGLSISHVLTSGNSCDVDVADYVAYLAEDPACRAIACVFEGMADPGRLLQAAGRAWRVDKPLIIYKMASGLLGAEAAMSHTGSLAGPEAAYRAAFAQAGVVQVDTLEALMETAAFFAKAGAPKGRGVAVVATSGGASIMAADKSEMFGVALPQPGPAAAAVLARVVPDFGSARNPCDVTAQVLADEALLRECAGALLADPLYSALVSPQAIAYAPAVARLPLLSELAAQSGKPVCNVFLPEWEGPGSHESERDPHIALFRSMERCFRTLAAWHTRDDRRSEGRPADRVAIPPDAMAKAATLIQAATGPALSERESKAVLACYGVPVVSETLVASAEAAVAAAQTCGYPVVLKLESADVPHKTDAGVIALHLAQAAAVQTAYVTIMERASAIIPAPRIAGIVVQPMVPAGVEVMIGGRVDPLFGPLVVVGLGGILVELLQDSAVGLAPLGLQEARGMLARLKGAALLRGFRGSEPVDLHALATLICRVSELLADHAATVAELDVNPLICSGSRILAVDGLIVRSL